MALESVSKIVRAAVASSFNKMVPSGLTINPQGLPPESRVAKAFKPPKQTKYITSTYSYPDNVGNDSEQGHHIIFTISSFTPSKLKVHKTQKSFDEIYNNLTSQALKVGASDFSNLSNTDEFTTAANNQIENSASFANDMTGKVSAANGGGRSLLASKGRKITGDIISLYMPPSVQVSYEVTYADQEIGTIAMLGKDALDAFRGNSGNTESKLRAVASELGQGGKEGLTNLINASLDTLAPGARALQQIDSGRVITPRMEMMFSGVGRRNFSFTFNFIPKTAEEARNIERIIYTFKENMMPEYSNDETRREMNIPNVFDIRYMYRNQENGFINKISTCFLRKVDVKYGADRYTAYEPTYARRGGGPPPQKSEITLDFVEMETLSKEMIYQGY